MSIAESLPPSVLQLIIQDVVSYSSRRSRALLATVCRSWRDCVEQSTFKDLQVDTARLEQLQKIIDSRRLSYVASITLHLARTTSAVANAGDELSERAQASLVFSQNLQRLLEILAKDAYVDSSKDGIRLHVMFNSTSPSDTATSSRAKRQRAQSGNPKGVLPIKLDVATSSGSSGSSTLPRVYNLSELQFEGRHVHLESMVTLLSRLPRLAVLHVELEYDTMNQEDLEQRVAFVRGLEEHGSTIQSLRLCRPQMLYHHPSSATGHFARNKFYDHLLRYSHRLDTFHFDDCIDARSFFRPYRPSSADATAAEASTWTTGNTSLPEWNHLTRLSMRNTYMIRQPYLRTKSRVSAYRRIQDLMTVVGAAVQYMPRLQYLRLVQIMLDDGALKSSKLVYECPEEPGQQNFEPLLRVSGIQPGAQALQCWRVSVVKTRLADLKIDFSVDVDATGETLSR